MYADCLVYTAAALELGSELSSLLCCSKAEGIPAAWDRWQFQVVAAKEQRCSVDGFKISEAWMSRRCVAMNVKECEHKRMVRAGTSTCDPGGRLFASTNCPQREE
eukprot:3940104-Rhodomonas_salina.1